MKYYPVIIPTLNRYEHFKRCVESLSRNTHADKTELIIGLDYPPSMKYEKGYKQIKEYIPSIAGFKKVTVFERRENYGAHKNYCELQKYAFANYDAIISSEDDNEFSPCFLDYMNKMLNYYYYEPKISSISGYTHLDYNNLSKKKIIFTKECNCWGYGIWKNKEIGLEKKVDIVFSSLQSIKRAYYSFKSFPSSFLLLMKMIERKQIWGDIVNTQFNIFQDKYQVRPSVSLCRNWGNDGSGLHCGIDRSFENQETSSNSVFEITDYVINADSKIIKATTFIGLPNKTKSYVKCALQSLLYYGRVRYLKRSFEKMNT